MYACMLLWSKARVNLKTNYQESSSEELRRIHDHVHGASFKSCYSGEFGLHENPFLLNSV